MIRVRFDTGLVLQYNDANYVEAGETFHRIKKSSTSDTVARVPVSCVVEFYAPCRVYREGQEMNGAQIEGLVRRNVRLQRMNRELRAKARVKR